MKDKTVIGTYRGQDVSLDDNGDMVYASTGNSVFTTEGSVLTGSTYTDPFWHYQGTNTNISGTNVNTSYGYVTSNYTQSYSRQVDLNNKFVLIKKEKGTWEAYKALLLISGFDYSVSYQDGNGELKTIRLDKFAILGDQDLINKSIQRGVKIIESWPKELLTADEEDMRDIIE